MSAWWKEHAVQGPDLDMLPEESTFIVENEAGEKSLCATVYLTNACLAWADNFVRNPQVKAAYQFQDTVQLLKHLERFAESRGKRILFCMSISNSTDILYRKLGFKQTASGASTFIKGVN